MQRVHGDKTDALFWGWFNGWNNSEIQDWDMHPVINQIACPCLLFLIAPLNVNAGHTKSGSMALVDTSETNEVIRFRPAFPLLKLLSCRPVSNCDEGVNTLEICG